MNISWNGTPLKIHDTCFLLSLSRLACDIYNSLGNFISSLSYNQWWWVLGGAKKRDEKELLVAVKSYIEKIKRQ